MKFWVRRGEGEGRTQLYKQGAIALETTRFELETLERTLLVPRTKCNVFWGGVPSLLSTAVRPRARKWAHHLGWPLEDGEPTSTWFRSYGSDRGRGDFGPIGPIEGIFCGLSRIEGADGVSGAPHPTILD